MNPCILLVNVANKIYDVNIASIDCLLFICNKYRAPPYILWTSSTYTVGVRFCMLLEVNLAANDEVLYIWRVTLCEL